MFYVSLSSFISPMFWVMGGIGVYFFILLLAERRGKEVDLLATVSGIGLSLGMFIYCVMKFF